MICGFNDRNIDFLIIDTYIDAHPQLHNKYGSNTDRYINRNKKRNLKIAVNVGKADFSLVFESAVGFSPRLESGHDRYTNLYVSTVLVGFSVRDE